MKHSELTFKKRINEDPIPYPILLLADESIKAINKYIHECDIYLIKINNNSIGVCAIQEIDSSSFEIKNLAITEKYRNQGIGSWCLQKIEDCYPTKNLLVGTGDASLSALRFYIKNGFKKHTIRKDFFLNNYDQPIIENGIRLKDQIVLIKPFQNQSPQS